MPAASTGGDAFFGNARGVREGEQTLHLPGARSTHVRGAHRVVQLQAAAEVEPLDDLAGVEVREVAVGDVATAPRTRSRADGLGALQLALVLQLELAGDRRQRGVDVGDARHGDRLRRGIERAPLGVREHVLHHRNRQPLADARALVDAPILTRLEGDLLDDLRHEAAAPRRAVPASLRCIQASCAVMAIASARPAG